MSIKQEHFTDDQSLAEMSMKKKLHFSCKTNTKELGCPNQKQELQCCLCQKIFRYKGRLNKHIQVQHSDEKAHLENIHKCRNEGADMFDDSVKDSVSMQVPSRRSYVGHFKCTICGKTFTLKRSLTIHLKEIHKCQPYDDKVLPLSNFTNSRNNLISVSLTDLEQGCGQSLSLPDRGLFVCSEKKCRKQFMKHDDLLSHVSSEHDAGIFKCPTCGKHIQHDRNIKRHILSHSRRRPYGCDQCFKSFNTELLLRNHMTIAHTDEFSNVSELQTYG